MSGDKLTVTPFERNELRVMGYTVVDARNPIVETGWLMRAPGIDDRAWVTATEDDAWLAAYRHCRRTNTATELVEALRWALSQSALSYTRRIKGQNEHWCDQVDKAREALALHDRGETK